MFSSQDDISYTPRGYAPKFVPSPKRNKHQTSGVGSLDLNLVNTMDLNSQTLLSHDSPALSQFSVDFADRLNQLSVRIHQDDYLLKEEDDEEDTGDEVFSSMDSAKCNYYSNANAANYNNVDTSKKKRPAFSRKASWTPRGASGAANNNNQEQEKQMDLRPAQNNPFLHLESHPVEQYFQKYFHIPKGPTKLWVGAFKERSRLITDFEELTVLGEGTFSYVYCVRHRIDGTLYAIKKLKEYIMNENHLHFVLREISALSILRNCPHMIQYYHSWIDDNQVYIQMELCHLGTLEDMFSSIPSKSSIFRVANKPIILHTDTTLTTGHHPQHPHLFSRTESIDSYVTETNSLRGTRSNSIESQDMKNLMDMSSSSIFQNINIRGISEEFGWFVLKIVSEALDYMHQFSKCVVMYLPCYCIDC